MLEVPKSCPKLTPHFLPPLHRPTLEWEGSRHYSSFLLFPLPMPTQQQPKLPSQPRTKLGGKKHRLSVWLHHSLLSSAQSSVLCHSKSESGGGVMLRYGIRQIVCRFSSLLMHFLVNFREDIWEMCFFQVGASTTLSPSNLCVYCCWMLRVVHMLFLLKLAFAATGTYLATVGFPHSFDRLVEFALQRQIWKYVFGVEAVTQWQK